MPWPGRHQWEFLLNVRRTSSQDLKITFDLVRNSANGDIAYRSLTWLFSELSTLHRHAFKASNDRLGLVLLMSLTHDLLSQFDVQLLLSILEYWSLASFFYSLLPVLISLSLDAFQQAFGLATDRSRPRAHQMPREIMLRCCICLLPYRAGNHAAKSTRMPTELERKRSRLSRCTICQPSLPRTGKHVLRRKATNRLSQSLASMLSLVATLWSQDISYFCLHLRFLLI
jgi:hypothetical protein